MGIYTPLERVLYSMGTSFVPPAPAPVAGVSVWLVLGSIVLACHGHSRVYDDMPLYARCMLGTMRKQPRRSFVEGGLQKQADGDYLVLYGDLSAISFIILSSAPQKLVECRKSRNFGKIMRSTRQVYEPVYAGHDIIGARWFTSAPPPRKKTAPQANHLQRRSKRTM